MVLQDVRVRGYTTGDVFICSSWLMNDNGFGRECLDRRRLKQESKEKARVMRETEKLERDARRRKAEQMKEEMLTKKSVEAIEHKAKRVLEMQDRILSRKKIKYKDKEEEKLGKMAEELAQTVRSAKEKLEKLEKEDAVLKRKEEALKKKKRGMDGIPSEVIEDASRPVKPTCVLPVALMYQLLNRLTLLIITGQRHAILQRFRQSTLARCLPCGIVSMHSATF